MNVRICPKAQVIAKGIRNTENIFMTLGSGMLFMMMVVGASDVIGRYCFNRPIPGTLEISANVLMVGVVILGWASTQAARAHVAVQFVVARFPPRAQAMANLANLILSLVLFSFITWQAVITGMKSWEEHRIILNIHVPVAVMHFVVSLGACLICLEFIIQLVQLLQVMRKSYAGIVKS